MSVSIGRQRVTAIGWIVRPSAMVRGLAGACAMAWLLAGCTSIDQTNPKPSVEAAALPDAAPKTTGVDSPAIREHKQLVHVFGGEYHSVATEKLLDEVLAKLAVASEVPSIPYKLTILNSPVVNAFALPSGRIYVTRGLLALANDTSEVAAVMAHEIAHVTARHATQRAEIEKQSAVISQAANVIEDRNKGRSFQAYAQLSLASFSRLQELEADRIGVHTIARAGYDPYAASRFLQSLGRSSAMRQSLFGQASVDKPDMMSTHPSTPERIERAIGEARQIGAPGIGEIGRDRYLAAIDGLPFGDDPAEGFVRGVQFVHPKLGFAFTAPDGFVLENSAQAVLGIANGGEEALRLDRVHVPAETTLQAYLVSGWIDGLQEGSVENIVVNGFQAATATAKGSEWTFRLAAIRYGGEVYRMIFAAKTLSDADDRAFRTSINTFRKITPDEAKNVRPMRIDIVTASDTDTEESLVAKMKAADRPLDLFRVLNDVEAGAALKGGQRYKIVTE
ncbi:M48 family metalloprotease [Lichenihabitans sp. PAMC28606]|uniref:M48 family metalloprotease n=1 Tax=Lichenihabitans sp. PAMC28606 TaxID=2880932 RepID=UPI001D0A6FDF|nr:M48 family metalloprotease [Lichenihabitans sp. PAMC28606]UDL94484.1 M48 family metalloprotease [Lichenihabitans sp. PAMC28606]